MTVAARHAHVLSPNTIMTAQGAALFDRDWGAGSPVLFLAGDCLSARQEAGPMQL
jgi:hypothetical protein